MQSDVTTLLWSTSWFCCWILLKVTFSFIRLLPSKIKTPVLHLSVPTFLSCTKVSITLPNCWTIPLTASFLLLPRYLRSASNFDCKYRACHFTHSQWERFSLHFCVRSTIFLVRTYYSQYLFCIAFLKNYDLTSLWFFIHLCSSQFVSNTTFTTTTKHKL